MIKKKIIGVSQQVFSSLNECQVKPEWKIEDYIRNNFNSLSHALGVILAVAFLVVLSFFSYGNLNKFAVALLYTFCAGCLFGSSATLHFLSESLHIPLKVEEFLDRLDHSAIFLLIAGSYTPIILETIAQPWRSYMLIFIWAFAIVGILSVFLRHLLPRWVQHKNFQVMIYLVMGWTMLFRFEELWTALPNSVLYFICAEAAFYSIGALIYALEKPNNKSNYFGYHQIWHTLVLFGFISHSMAVIFLYTKTY